MVGREYSTLSLYRRLPAKKEDRTLRGERRKWPRAVLHKGEFHSQKKKPSIQETRTTGRKKGGLVNRGENRISHWAGVARDKKSHSLTRLYVPNLEGRRVLSKRGKIKIRPGKRASPPTAIRYLLSLRTRRRKGEGSPCFKKKRTAEAWRQAIRHYRLFSRPQKREHSWRRARREEASPTREKKKVIKKVDWPRRAYCGPRNRGLLRGRHSRTAKRKHARFRDSIREESDLCRKGKRLATKGERDIRKLTRSSIGNRHGHESPLS